MTRITGIIPFLAITLAGAICLSAQTADLQMVVMQNNGTYLDVKMQLRGSIPFPLYTSNFVITYTGDIGNGTVGAAPTLLTPHNFYGGNYGSAVNWFTTPIAGRVSINPVLLGVQLTDNVDTLWTDIATIRFTTLNPAGSASLTWRTTGSGRTYVYKSDNPSSTLLTFGNTIVNLYVNPLPVELQSFAAKKIGNDVELKWVTASESNNYGFEVERKIPAGDWEKIGFKAGMGASTRLHEYGFVDALANMNFQQSVLTYRLKMVDLDGTSTYSPSVSVFYGQNPDAPVLHATYPNPLQDKATVHFNLGKDETVTVGLYDITGREVIRLVNNEHLASGYYARVIDADQFPSGSYIVRLSAGNISLNETIVIKK